MNSHRRLFVWEASVDLAARMLILADSLTARRRFAIADQVTRAALSIPSNIAEGQGRSTTRDRRHYFVQARGSLYELETQLEVITRAHFAKDVTGVHEEIKRISAGLSKIIRRLDESLSTTRPLVHSSTPKPSSS